MNINWFFSLCLFGGLSFIPLNAAEQVISAPAITQYEAKNYDHLLGKITGLDDALLRMHFKLYEGYVKNSNLVLQKLQVLNQENQNKTPEFGALKRILGWEMDGMLLHELYFGNLGAKDRLDDKDPLMLKMQSDFGGYDQWKTDFIATGSMRGIGWVVAYVDPKNGRLVNTWINEHDVGHLAGGTPVLVMDVFEHAYITQFGLDKAKYIDVFFNNINWPVVAERYKDKR